MELNLTTLQSDLKIIQGTYKFRKHYQGKLIVSGGTAQRYVIRDLLHGNIPQQTLDNDNNINGNYKQNILFDIPTRNVSPTFTSRHIHVYYDLCFTITFEESHFLKRNNTIQCDFSIPLNIANLPNDELIRVPDLVAIQYYNIQPTCLTETKKYPEFFDPSQPDDTDLPPSYCTSSALQNQQQLVERTVYLTCPAPLYTVASPSGSGGSSHFYNSGCNNSNNNYNTTNNNNGITIGCSSTTNYNHQRHGSFPDVGEATLIHGVYNENR